MNFLKDSTRFQYSCTAKWMF